jgi:hypothetical protein
MRTPTLSAEYAIGPALGVYLARNTAVRPAAGVSPAVGAISDTILARGLNNGSCNAQSIADGDNDYGRGTRPDDVLQRLSVSCVPRGGLGALAQVKGSLSGLYPYMAYGLLSDFPTGAQVVPEPVDGNPYHCVLSGITAKQFCANAKVALT